MLLLKLAQQAAAAQRLCQASQLRGVLRGGRSAGRLTGRGQDHLHDAAVISTSVARKIHTTRPVLVNPALLAILRPVSKFLAVLVGRGFRKWWQALPQHKRQVFMGHLRRNRVRYAVASCVVGTAGVVYYHNHVTTTPYTGRRRFMLLKSDQLFSMSSQLYEMEMEQYAHMMLPEEHPMVECVQRVGNRLLQANSTLPELYTKTWTVSLIDNPVMNCFVMPTGDIVMFRGMMEALENDDQVAAVLAHEMSHAILDHAAEHLNRGYLLDLVILVPVTLIWAVLPSDLLAVVSHWLLNFVVTLFLTLPYSRTLESEADYFGLRLAAKACFDVREFSALWGKMSVLEKIKDKIGQGTDGPAWMSTHPTNEDRQRELEKQMTEALDLRQSCKCPPLSLRDPREPIKRLQQVVAQQGTQVLPKVVTPKEYPAPPSGEIVRQSAS